MIVQRYRLTERTLNYYKYNCQSGAQFIIIISIKLDHNGRLIEPHALWNYSVHYDFILYFTGQTGCM